MKMVTTRDVAHAASVTLCPIGDGRMLAFAALDLARCPESAMGAGVPCYLGYAAPTPDGMFRVFCFDESTVEPGASPEAFHTELPDIWNRCQLQRVFHELGFGDAGAYLPPGAPLPPQLRLAEEVDALLLEDGRDAAEPRAR